MKKFIVFAAMLTIAPAIANAGKVPEAIRSPITLGMAAAIQESIVWLDENRTICLPDSLTVGDIQKIAEESIDSFAKFGDSDLGHISVNVLDILRKKYPCKSGGHPKVTSENPASSTVTDLQNEPDGFRDLKWGTVIVGPDQATAIGCDTFYTRNLATNNDLQYYSLHSLHPGSFIGMNIELLYYKLTPEYRFYEVQFNVRMHNATRFLGLLKEKYGKPTSINNLGAETTYKWEGNESSVLFIVGNSKKYHTVCHIYNKKLVALSIGDLAKSPRIGIDYASYPL